MRKVNAVFVASSSLILIIFGAAKIVSAFLDTPKIDAPDEILLLSNRHVFLGVGLLELSTATYLFCSRDVVKKLWALLWLGSMFLTYRIGLDLMHVSKLCSCLGVFPNWFPNLWAYAAIVIKVCLAYLLLGSTILLFINLQLAEPTIPDAHVKATH